MPSWDANNAGILGRWVELFGQFTDFEVQHVTASCNHNNAIPMFYKRSFSVSTMDQDANQLLYPYCRLLSGCHSGMLGAVRDGT